MLNYLTTFNTFILKSGIVRQSPIHIQLEPTTYCNFDCKICTHANLYQEHMSIQNMKNLLEQIQSRKVSLTGLGEPFMNPNLPEMISLAKKQASSVDISTNATLLTPEICAQVVKSGLDLIRISIDGATRETYQIVRGTDKLLHVLDGIRSLVEAKKQLGSFKPFIRLNYVIVKGNYHEIGKTVELADKIGVDAVYFQPLELVGIENRRDALIGNWAYEDLVQEITYALEVNQKYQIDTNLRSFRKNLVAYWKRNQIETSLPDQQTCILPWFYMYIAVDGTVYPCCSALRDNRYGNMGNVFRSTIQEIWNGEKYQTFRKAMRETKHPYKICEYCMSRQTLTDVIKNFLIYSRNSLKGSFHFFP